MKNGYRIGLTGLIGSGKSLAASYFAKLGIDVIDTDVISHAITSPNGLAIAPLIQAFGPKYIDSTGALDRDLMRAVVFKNKLEKYKLESILHPLIFDEMIAKANLSKSIYTIIVVPLLFQSPKYYEYMNRSIFVDCDESAIIDRVIKRNGWDEETVQRVLDSQMPRVEQMKLADEILDNNKTLADLELQVQKLHEKLGNLAKI